MMSADDAAIGKPPVVCVWGIGLTRTGTSSLNDALRILGFEAEHWPTLDTLLHGHLRAATDECVAAVYKFLDLKHPGSKFILTERPIDDWLRSTAVHRSHSIVFSMARAMRAQLVASGKTLAAEGASEHDLLQCMLEHADHVAQFRDRLVELTFTQSALYETVEFDEAKFRIGYERHQEDVARYFRNRPNDLLRMNLSKGDGWEKLAPFLGRSVPAVPFPHGNSIEGMVAHLRKEGGEEEALSDALRPRRHAPK
jgi:hypothetical protein